MKKLFTALTILSALILSSCGKEDSIETGGGGGNTGGNNNGALLIRMVARLSPNDSLGYSYAYDNNRRVSNTKSFIVAPSAGILVGSENRVTRNSNGIITDIISVFTEGTNVQQYPYKVNYNASNNRYTSKVATINDNGMQIKDSTAYEFDGAGKVSRETAYFSDGSTGGYVPYSKTEFTYGTNGNLTKYSYYQYDSSTNTWTIQNETTLEYDAKVNPIQLGNESHLLGLYESASSNNILKSTYKDFEDNTNNYSNNFVFTYNSENKPTKAETTYQGIPITLNYVYQ